MLYVDMDRDDAFVLLRCVVFGKELSCVTRFSRKYTKIRVVYLRLYINSMYLFYTIYTLFIILL